ncbi:hypothetical protein AAFF_G00072310, partial [Aldrovandia affinis]
QKRLPTQKRCIHRSKVRSNTSGQCPWLSRVLKDHSASCLPLKTISDLPCLRRDFLPWRYCPLKANWLNKRIIKRSSHSLLQPKSAVLSCDDGSSQTPDGAALSLGSPGGRYRRRLMQTACRNPLSPDTPAKIL